ncbi:hypothetical protein GCM10018780_82560 [Streptomyces lanatus]|nr:hypothetical protein GCM10018780_82560 [Streptomyces lanatus]
MRRNSRARPTGPRVAPLGPEADPIGTEGRLNARRRPHCYGRLPVAKYARQTVPSKSVAISRTRLPSADGSSGEL